MAVPLKLELLKSLLPEVSIQANPRFTPEEETSEGFSTSISHSKKDEDVHAISMTVEMANDSAPYKFKVTSLVFISLIEQPEGVKEEEVIDSVTAYGVQIAYGSIREQLHTLSLRGPWERYPVVLEICDIAGMMRDHKARADVESDS